MEVICSSVNFMLITWCPRVNFVLMIRGYHYEGFLLCVIKSLSHTQCTQVRINIYLLLVVIRGVSFRDEGVGVPELPYLWYVTALSFSMQLFCSTNNLLLIIYIVRGEGVHFLCHPPPLGSNFSVILMFYLVCPKYLLYHHFSYRSVLKVKWYLFHFMLLILISRYLIHNC